ncbi:MAG: peptidoglycan binding domain-containing protein [Tissierellia bacterium]|nr:peptidoglycan binding domain-containing protein [Tissierellia bacterium]
MNKEDDKNKKLNDENPDIENDKEKIAGDEKIRNKESAGIEAKGSGDAEIDQSKEASDLNDLNSEIEIEDGLEEKDKVEEANLNREKQGPELDKVEASNEAEREKAAGVELGEEKSDQRTESSKEGPKTFSMQREEDSSEEKVKKRGFWKFLIIPLVLAVFYFAVAIYFTDRALPNTFVNGRDVSMEYISQIDPLEGLSVNEIEIAKKDGKVVVLKPEDADIKLELEKALLIQQDNFRWPLSLIEKDEYQVDIVTKYDEGKLNSFINENFIEGAEEPQDAKLEKKDGVFVIIPEVEGNKIDEDVVRENIMNAVVNAQEKVDLSELYESPSIRQDDEKLQKVLGEIKEYTNKELDIDFIFTKEKIDENLLSSFVDLGEDMSVKINKDMLHEYVQNLAIKYDTYDKPREFESTNRGIIEVPPGIYGYQMDVESTEKLIEESLANGTAEIAPIYNIEGSLRTEDGSDIGSTYIEIDISNQYMWYYENGELIVSTPVVTGDPTRGVATPPGANVVWHKERNKPLTGTDPDGNPYVAPVDYWMAVDWSHNGIHNARWRENAGGFGGSIYIGNGSFGCINTPYDAVATIFENVSVGTPVLMYN